MWRIAEPGSYGTDAVDQGNILFYIFEQFEKAGFWPDREAGEESMAVREIYEDASEIQLAA